MASRGQRKTRTVPYDLLDPRGMGRLLEKYLTYLEVHHYSPSTVRTKRTFLALFIQWAADRGLTRPSEITKPILERYQAHLFNYRKTNGDSLTIRSQHTRMSSVRGWFKWLARENHILYNPASEIELPRVGVRLPQCVLTPKEADTIINIPDVDTVLGIRDRAILETFYSTGMRRMELVNLLVYHMDLDRLTVMIHQGKGRKDRMVPIGQRATGWIKKYLDQCRPKLIFDIRERTLFLTNDGYPFTYNRMTEMVREYVNAADLEKKGSCHLFRHTMATAMLENGADIRYIQAMLGHASIETMEIYTQVSIRKLQQIHQATHPAKVEREPKGQGRCDVGGDGSQG